MTRLALLIILACATLCHAQTEAVPLVPAPSAPAPSPTVEGQRVAHRHARLGLVIGGAAIFGVTYTLSALGGGVMQLLTSGAGPNYSLAVIPVVGPLLGTNQQLLPLSLSSTGLQLGGLALLISGFVFSHTTWTLEHEVVSLEFGPTGIQGRF